MLYIKKSIGIIMFTCISLFSLFSYSQHTQIDLIFDASGSMWGQIDGVTKIEIAREALSDLLFSFENKKNTQLALRVYGHLNKECTNSIVEVPMSLNNSNQIKSVVNSIKPLGKTPIAYSLEQAVKDFKTDISGEKIIILITDGIESCDGDSCKISENLKSMGIVTNLHIVGFGMTEKELKSFECIVKPFNGKVLGASNAKELADAFQKISESVTLINNLSIQGLDKNNEKVYMDVEILQNSKVIISSEGTNPLFSLKEGTYTISAKSRETGLIIKKENVSIKKEEIKQLTYVFEEASLKLKAVNSKGQAIYAFYTVYEHGTNHEILSAQGTDFIEKTILPGVYDLKIYEQDTYSTLWVKNIKVNPGDIFEQVIKFEMGSVRIIPKAQNGKLSTEYWWYHFFKSGKTEKEKQTTEGVGEKEVEMLPGTYSLHVLDGYNNVVKQIDNIVVQKGSKTDVVCVINTQ